MLKEIDISAPIQISEVLKYRGFDTKKNIPIAVLKRERRPHISTNQNEDDSSFDIFGMHLEEIWCIPRISDEESDHLVRTMIAGRYFDDNEHKLEKMHFFPNQDDARKAFHTLVVSNLRLVVPIAKKYFGRGLEPSELCNEGAIGLMRGIVKFNPKLGFRLSTYTSWWIRQAVSLAVADTGSLIRIPVNKGDKKNHYLFAVTHLTEILERDPTNADIAVYLGMSEKKVEELRRLSLIPFSLNEPQSDYKDAIEFGDSLPDPFDAYGAVEDSFDVRTIQEEINMLSERDRKILLFRFGYIDGESHTLEETGLHFGITKERARQIEQKTIKKLKCLLIDDPNG